MADIIEISAKERKLLKSLGLPVPKKVNKKAIRSKSKDIQKVFTPTPYTLGVQSTCRLCKSVHLYAVKLILIKEPGRRPHLEIDHFATPLYTDADRYCRKETNTCIFCSTAIKTMKRDLLEFLVINLSAYSEPHIIRRYANIAWLTESRVPSTIDTTSGV
jgi:hypothetical protein